MNNEEVFKNKKTPFLFTTSACLMQARVVMVMIE